MGIRGINAAGFELGLSLDGFNQKIDHWNKYYNKDNPIASEDRALLYVDYKKTEKRVMRSIRSDAHEVAVAKMLIVGFDLDAIKVLIPQLNLTNYSSEVISDNMDRFSLLIRAYGIDSELKKLAARYEIMSIQRDFMYDSGMSDATWEHESEMRDVASNMALIIMEEN